MDKNSDFSQIIWRTEKRKIKDLKFYPNNPRFANEKDFQDLEKSIEKFNLADPLIINHDNTVIGGNFRLKVLQKKGIEEIDVRVPSRPLSKEEADELNLRLNKNQGRWDWGLLANFNESLLNEVGFSEEELKNITDFDFEDIQNTEDRERKFKDILVTCPHCQKSFNIKV